MPYVLLLAACLFPFAAMAEELSVPTLLSNDQLLSAVTLDLNQDGVPDQALLVRGKKSADLYVYLSSNSADGQRRSIVRQGAAFLGSKVGMLPSLEVTGNDKLLLKSGNDVLGRSQFEQTLQLTLQNDQLLVTGLSYQHIDPLSPEANARCELDLINGKGEVNTRSIVPSVKAAPIATWDVESPPGECLF